VKDTDFGDRREQGYPLFNNRLEKTKAGNGKRKKKRGSRKKGKATGSCFLLDMEFNLARKVGSEAFKVSREKEKRLRHVEF